MKNLGAKILIVIGGVLSAFILLEICLRILGLFYGMRDAGKERKTSGNYTILTLGDSFTYGIGSTDGKTYPNQLEQMLNSKTNKKFNVINGGLNGENSAQVVENIERNIQKYHPDLIVFLIGGNNFWNFYNYSKPQNNILYKIRTYKLMKLLYKNIKDKYYPVNKNNVNYKIEEYPFESGYYKFIDISGRLRFYILKYHNTGVSFMKAHEFEKALNWFKKQSQIEPGKFEFTEGYVYSCLLLNKYEDAVNYLKENVKYNLNNFRFYSIAGFVFNLKHEYLNAINWLQKGIEADSNYSILYYQLAKANFCIGNIRESDKWLAKGIEIDPLCFDFLKYLKKTGQNKKYPESTKTGVNLTVHYNTELYDKYNDTIEINRVFMKMDNEKKDISFIDISDISLDKNNHLIFNWIIGDITKLISVCNEKNIKIIFQNYPVNHHPHPDLPVNYLLNAYFDKWVNIPFVNNEALFTSKADSLKYFFVTDGHCNNPGYKLMAKNVFEKIISEKMFDVEMVKR